MSRTVWASAKLAASLIAAGTVIIAGLATVGCAPRPEGSIAANQSQSTHPVSTGTEATSESEAGEGEESTGQGQDENSPFLALTRDTFDELVLNADKPVVVIFTSRKCGVCKKVEGQMVELANEFKDSVEFFKVGKYVAPELVMQFKVHAFPTVVLFTGGEQVDRWGGLEAKKLEAELTRLLGKEQ